MTGRFFGPKLRRALFPLLAVGISVVATLAFSCLQNNAKRGEFNSLSENRVRAVTRHIERYTDLLKALQGFARSAHVDSWGDMHEFVNAFAEPGKDIVRFYWWAPRVSRRVAQPLEAYPDDPIGIVPGTEVFDHLMKRARATGRPAAEIVSGDRPACIVALSVSHPEGRDSESNDHGVILSFRIADFVEDALASFAAGGIDLQVYDGRQRLIYSHAAAKPAESLGLARVFRPAPAEWRRNWPVRVGDLSWQVVATPGEAYLRLSETLPRWGVFFATLVISMLISVNFERRCRQAAQAEERVRLRTSELMQTRGSLQEEIRERKQAEASLQENRLWLRFVQEAVGIGVWDWDCWRERARFSPQNCVLNDLDITNDEVDLDCWLRALHPDDRELASSQLRQLLSGLHTSGEIQYRICDREGEVRWVMVKGRRIGAQILGATFDITGLKHIEQALRESEDRFRKVYADATVGMAMCDHRGQFVLVNRAFCDISGYPESELVGRLAVEMVPVEDRPESSQRMRDVMSGAVSSYRAEQRVVRKDGALRWLRISVSAIEAEGKPRTLIALCEDISEQVTARNSLTHKAMHDSLTGLPNRRAFENELARAIAQAADDRCSPALIYIDLDGFKRVNDGLGHATGDRLLVAVVQRLSAAMGDRDILARVGGDEFTVILEHGSDCGAVGRLAETIIRSLEEPFALGDTDLFISASIGISLFPQDGTDGVTLLQHADSAMYRAKREGKGRYRFFTREMRQQATARLELKSSLQGSIERGEIEVHFQPLLNSGTNSITRFEALCRWRHPDWGYVPPSTFIPAAEETGFIVQLGSYVLQEACHRAREWNEMSSRRIPVAVNVSPVQFARADFVEEVLNILAEAGLHPSLLELELTESVASTDVEAATRKMWQLRTIGVTLAMDDFGTGYSSLSHLHKMPIDTLKIDRSFIQNVFRDPESEKLVGSLISLAHGLGLRVVSEGVETESQAAVLRSLGCDELQGFLLGRPESAGQALGRLEGAGMAEEDIPALTGSRQ